MKEFGVDYSKAKDILTEAGFKMTTDKDEIMGFRIWKRSLQNVKSYRSPVRLVIRSCSSRPSRLRKGPPLIRVPTRKDEKTRLLMCPPVAANGDLQGGGKKKEGNEWERREKDDVSM